MTSKEKHSRQDIDAYVAMIMVNLPFPPLPVCGKREGDTHCEDAIVSGHDLLSQAIACTLVGPQDNDTGTGTAVQTRKAMLLENMHNRVAEIWKSGKQSEAWKVQACYDVFCSTFRAYMQLYPGPDDLRILPLDAVDVKSVLCTQAASHLSARLQITIRDSHDEDVVAVAAPLSFFPGMRYHDLVKAYIVNLHSASV